VTRRLIVEADGGSRGNPGPAGYGAVVSDASTGEVLAEISDGLGTATNNVAEYSGLVSGLRAAAQLVPGADVEVRMDSRLVVEQMSGRWQVKDAALRSLADAAMDASSRLGNVAYTWIPRARNARADGLANQAMDRAAPADGGGRADRGAQAEGSAAGSGAAGASPASRVASAPGSAAAAPARGWGPQGRATTTILLRHGQTALSVERRFAGSGDVPLTDTGVQQAAAAAARLAVRGGIDLVVSSPLSRARRTAEAVADATGAGLLIDDDLAETDFGEWEGLTFAEVMKQWPEEMSAWMGSTDLAPPGGESLSGAARRALAALDRLLAGHTHKTIVVVSHVTPIKTIICRALLAPPAALFRIHLDVASLSEADWFTDGPALLRSLNDTAHLRAETPPTGRKGTSRVR
jgi:ribonuclease H / adenosylcobalamin/alpha-ribazole phosphatase